jgi:DNA polymerase III gamma/tau subunit
MERGHLPHFESQDQIEADEILVRHLARAAEGTRRDSIDRNAIDRALTESQPCRRLAG